MTDPLQARRDETTSCRSLDDLDAEYEAGDLDETNRPGVAFRLRPAMTPSRRRRRTQSSPQRSWVSGCGPP
ncbi:MAG: hypothetical protein R2695_04825 [Acidimicrobiales bacterium]